MKYHVTISVAGKDIRIKNVEASNQDDAETKALGIARKSLKIIGSVIAPPIQENARPISGPDIFDKFFRKP